jgi:hypothetical protein
VPTTRLASERQSNTAISDIDFLNSSLLLDQRVPALVGLALIAPKVPRRLRRHIGSTSLAVLRGLAARLSFANSDSDAYNPNTNRKILILRHVVPESEGAQERQTHFSKERTVDCLVA